MVLYSGEVKEEGGIQQFPFIRPSPNQPNYLLPFAPAIKDDENGTNRIFNLFPQFSQTTTPALNCTKAQIKKELHYMMMSPIMGLHKDCWTTISRYLYLCILVIFALYHCMPV